MRFTEKLPLKAQRRATLRDPMSKKVMKMLIALACLPADQAHAVFIYYLFIYKIYVAHFTYHKD